MDRAILIILGFLCIVSGSTRAWAGEWTKFGYYEDKAGQTVTGYFDPDSVERVERSVFVWTTWDDPSEKGAFTEGLRYYVEINQSQIRLVRIENPSGEGSDFAEDDQPWEPIKDGSLDFQLYEAAVNVLRSQYEGRR